MPPTGDRENADVAEVQRLRRPCLKGFPVLLGEQFSAGDIRGAAVNGNVNAALVFSLFFVTE